MRIRYAFFVAMLITAPSVAMGQVSHFLDSNPDGMGSLLMSTSLTCDRSLETIQPVGDSMPLVMLYVDSSMF